MSSHGGSKKRGHGATDNPVRHGGSMSWGKIAHASGHAPALLAAGWLPRHAAANAMGITCRELDDAVAAGAIKRRKIGPGATLYQVITGESR